jgi:hypothetical protein
VIPREGRQKDALDPIADRPCHKLDERSDVTAIAPVEGSEVLPALAGRDQRRRIAGTNEHQIHREATGPTVAVAKGMDAFELGSRHRGLTAPAPLKPVFVQARGLRKMVTGTGSVELLHRS